MAQVRICPKGGSHFARQRGHLSGRRGTVVGLMALLEAKYGAYEPLGAEDVLVG